MYRAVKVAAISMKPTKWDKAGNADKLEAYFTLAAREQPQLIVAPEGVLEGMVAIDVIEFPEQAEAMLAVAEPIDGPYIQRFQRLARTLNTCLCFGFAERIANEIYNCAIFIDQSGEIRGRYHKVRFAEGYHPSWYFNRLGSTLRAFDTPLGRVGIVICADRVEPLTVRTLVLDGAQLILIPTFGSKARRQNQVVLGRARENGVPIVQANRGMNLIISKGDVVAYTWGNDQISAATVSIPEVPSTAAARRSEEEFLRQRGSEMERLYEQHMARLPRRRGERQERQAEPTAIEHVAAIAAS